MFGKERDEREKERKEDEREKTRLLERERCEHVVLRRSGSAAGARTRESRRSALAGPGGLARGRRSSYSLLDSDLGLSRSILKAE